MADELLAESEIEEGAPEADSKRLQEVHERAMRRFDAVALPQVELRAQSLEARRFTAIPGAMWEGAWGIQAENSPRPESDMISPMIDKIETDYRENRIEPDYIPADDMADQDSADTLDGLYRADSYHFKAQQALDNAFHEALTGGFGAWRETTDFADPYDPENESQRINPGMAIVDADQSVYFYGGILYDKSDAEAAFVVSRELRGIFDDKWGEENAVEWPVTNWKWQWDWYTPDVVCVAEYYEIEETDDRLIILTNELTEEEERWFESEIDGSEVSDRVAEGWKKSTRKHKRRRVRKYVMNGTKVLRDCGYIAGPNIPIIPVYGKRWFVDNMERWQGYTTKKMDDQRIFNVALGHLVEQQSLAPYPTPILLADQIAGYVTGPDGQQITLAEHWARGNIDRSPFRVILPVYDTEGKIVSTGPIGSIDPPQPQPATTALLQFTAGRFAEDNQNADEVKANTSADAMDIAADRVDQKSSIYLDNMAQSVQRAAEIYQMMAREVYFERGRKVETRTIDGKAGTATLLEGVIGPDGAYKVRNDLARGKYKVVASVQESTTTKRQKTVRQNMEIATIASGLQGTQDLAAAALLNAVMNQDGEGMQDMQKFARNKLIGLGVVEPTPEEKAQMEAAAQQNSEPSAADKALEATAEELRSKAALNMAGAKEKESSAILKLAQAEAVGGPVSEPSKPSGLEDADIADRMAAADLKNAQAEKLRGGLTLERIRQDNDSENERRNQDRADRGEERADRESKKAANE